ncbi:MAG: hypothetical protein E4G74_02620 [Erysipelotrichales bacterium]|nr:MAG: hypothetical protein E4G74_02620 [Erysipelotrichales bacterium]
MKVSNRDIAILKWLGLFIGFYLVWSLVLVPMDKKIATNRTALDGLRIQEQTTKATIPLRDSIAAEKNDIRMLVESQFNQFFDDSTPAQMEAFFVPLLSQFNVRFNYFEVSPTTVVAPKTTLSIKEGATYKIKTLIDEYNLIVKPAIEIPTTESELLKTRITYLLSMSFNDFLALSDAIVALDNSILITTAAYDFTDSTVELTFDIYTMGKIDFQE